MRLRGAARGAQEALLGLQRRGARALRLRALQALAGQGCALGVCGQRRRRVARAGHDEGHHLGAGDGGDARAVARRAAADQRRGLRRGQRRGAGRRGRTRLERFVVLALPGGGARVSGDAAAARERWTPGQRAAGLRGDTGWRTFGSTRPGRTRRRPAARAQACRRARPPPPSGQCCRAQAPRPPPRAAAAAGRWPATARPAARCGASRPLGPRGRARGWGPQAILSTGSRGRPRRARLEGAGLPPWTHCTRW